MNLMLVTYEGDNSQFLVNTMNKKEAVLKAIDANLSPVFGPYDKEYEADIKEPDFYSVEEVKDMDFLGEIIKRDDCIATYNGVVCFNG